MNSRSLMVGFFTLVVVTIMISFITWQSNITRRFTGFTLTARFDQVAGLIRGSEVRYRGFRVGRVLNVHPRPEYIDASFWVSGDVEITKGSRVKIMFDGLVGENYLSIEPNLKTTELVDSKEILMGRSASDLAHFIDLGHDNLLYTEAILKSLVDLVEDGQITDDIKDIFSNLNSLLSYTNTLVQGDEEQDIKTILKNIQVSSEMFAGLMESFSADELKQMVDVIISDVNTTSTALSNLTAQVEEVINNENVQHINSTIANFDDFSAGLSSFFGEKLERNDSFLKSIFNTSIINETSVFYDSSASSGYLDSDFSFNLNKFSFITGINNRSGKAIFDQFQQGYLFSKNLRTRIGVYQNKEAIGVDYFDFFKSNLRFDVYDFNNNLYELSIDYPIYQQFEIAFDTYNDVAGNGHYDFGVKLLID